MSITAGQVKKLRQQTGAGIMDCKQALKESDNNFDKAIQWLRKQDLSRVSKKSDRVTSEGTIASYIHGEGRIGVLVEVNSETDFVAKNQEFKNFVKDISLHIVAMNPSYVREEDIPQDVRNKEKEIFLNQAKEKKKNESTTQMIAEGLYKKWLSGSCLLNQEFVRQDSEKKETVSSVLTQLISKIGENITIRRFVRFALGEGIKKKDSDFEEEVKQAAKVQPCP